MVRLVPYRGLTYAPNVVQTKERLAKASKKCDGQIKPLINPEVPGKIEGLGKTREKERAG